MDDDIVLPQLGDTGSMDDNSAQVAYSQLFPTFAPESIQPSDTELRDAISKSFMNNDEKDGRNIDLSKIFPKEVLSRPLFTNKHAISTIQQLIQLEGLEVCQHLPCVCTALEILLQKTRGIHTRRGRDGSNNKKIIL